MRPVRSSALFTKDEATEFVSKPLGFGGIGCSAEALSKFEEGLLFLLAGLDSQLDQLDKDAVITQPPPIRYRLNLLRNRSGKGYTAPNLLRSSQ